MELSKHQTPTSSSKLFANTDLRGAMATMLTAREELKVCVALGTHCSPSSSSGGKSLSLCNSHPSETPKKTATEAQSLFFFLHQKPCRLNLLKVSSMPQTEDASPAFIHPPLDTTAPISILRLFPF